MKKIPWFMLFLVIALVVGSFGIQSSVYERGYRAGRAVVVDSIEATLVQDSSIMTVNNRPVFAFWFRESKDPNWHHIRMVGSGIWKYESPYRDTAFIVGDAMGATLTKVEP